MAVGGAELYVREVPGSDQETGVYLHGLGGSSTNWTDLAGLLSEWMHGLIPDLPGFGHSQPPPGYTYTMAEHASVVIDFLDQLDDRDRPPVHLFGNSMGGAVAMLVAASRPELVRSLTLVSPAVPDLRPFPSRLSDPRLPLAYLPVIGARTRRKLAAMTDQQRVDQLIRLCFASPEQVPPQRLVAAADEAAARRGMPWAVDALGRSAVGLVRAWLVPAPRSLWTAARRIKVPTLVVWGTQDKLVSVRKAPRTAAALEHSRLLVLPRTGHVAQMERPETVARAVLGMLDAARRGQW